MTFEQKEEFKEALASFLLDHEHLKKQDTYYANSALFDDLVHYINKNIIKKENV